MYIYIYVCICALHIIDANICWDPLPSWFTLYSVLFDIPFIPSLELLWVNIACSDVHDIFAPPDSLNLHEFTMDRVRHFGVKFSKLGWAEKEQAEFQLHIARIAALNRGLQTETSDRWSSEYKEPGGPPQLLTKVSKSWAHQRRGRGPGWNRKNFCNWKMFLEVSWSFSYLVFFFFCLWPNLTYYLHGFQARCK